MTAIPSYAVRLLMAAKFVVNPPQGRTPEGMAEDLDALQRAVIEFESKMPLVNGEIQEFEQ